MPGVLKVDVHNDGPHSSVTIIAEDLETVIVTS